MNDSSNPERDALMAIYENANSWPEVARILNGYLSNGTRVSSALAWKVANGRCKSPKVTMALVHGNYIDEPPPKVEVTVCPACGKLHKYLKSCPGSTRKDRRKRRAWAGTEEKAEIVDRMVRDMGFSSLAQFIDNMVDEYEYEDDDGQ